MFKVGIAPPQQVERIVAVNTTRERYGSADLLQRSAGGFIIFVVVFDDQQERRRLMFVHILSCSVKKKVVPTPGDDSSQIEPP